jgi:ABC-2 type transport system permease protein
MSSLRSPDTATVRAASIRPLLVKEFWGVITGRALWTMLLILCPLVGYSFFQAVSLYGEASAAARDAPALATGLSPLDGVLVPTFGAFYLAVTLLFPFVAIRALGREKETGALRLLVQLPYPVPTLIAAKMAAVMVAWLISVIPTLSALVLWRAFGGHLYVLETGNHYRAPGPRGPSLHGLAAQRPRQARTHVAEREDPTRRGPEHNRQHQ